MKRGELWTANGGSHYTGKPRPVLIVQDDRFDATDSITICPLTTDTSEIPLLRIPVAAHESAGLAQASSIMVDKVATVRRDRLGVRIGVVPEKTLASLSRALIVFLGMA